MLPAVMIFVVALVVVLVVDVLINSILVPFGVVALIHHLAYIGLKIPLAIT